MKASDSASTSKSLISEAMDISLSARATLVTGMPHPGMPDGTWGRRDGIARRGDWGLVRMPSLLHPAGPRCRRKASRKVTFRTQGAGRRQIAKGRAARSDAARQPESPWNRTIRNPQSRFRVVTVRLVDAEADRLPRVGHTRSETSCAVVPLRPLWQHAAR